MPTPQIYNSIASKDLDVVELVDPHQIEFYAKNIADQINTFRMGYTPQKRIVDLSKWISDIVIETSAQGGSLVQVRVIDPAWTMFIRDANGVSFIDADDTGYLWPPVEVNFPPDVSDATWRLCQVIVTSELTQPNVTLTFEDKIVAELREQYGQQVSYPEQTRAEFIQSLVKQANDNPTYPGEIKIRLVSLLPKEAFTAADLSLAQRLPASATQKFAPKARQNPNKRPKPVDPNTPPRPLTPAQVAAGATDLSIENGLAAFQAGEYRPFSPFAPVNVPPLGIGVFLG